MLFICCIHFNLACDITLNINNYCSLRLFDEQKPSEYAKEKQRVQYVGKMKQASKQASRQQRAGANGASKMVNFAGKGYEKVIIDDKPATMHTVF